MTSSDWNPCDGTTIGSSDRHQRDPDAEDGLCAACRATMAAADAAAPRSWVLFCERTKDGKLEHFYPAVRVVEMCGGKLEDIVRVRLEPAEDGDLWGWRYSHHPVNTTYRGQVSMIYSREMLVEMCFPYGTAAEKKRGRGEIVRLKAEILGPAKKNEAIGG
jgi:hypothetical protein